MLETKIEIICLCDRLDEMELNELKIKLKAEIEILENEEKRIKNVIPIFEKSKSELKNLYRTKKRNALMRSNIRPDLLKLLLG